MRRPGLACHLKCCHAAALSRLHYLSAGKFITENMCSAKARKERRQGRGLQLCLPEMDDSSLSAPSVCCHFVFRVWVGISAASIAGLTCQYRLTVEMKGSLLT